jgi:hypothetical protein
MASIKIFNLYPAGSELFKDSESFMTDLIDDELGNVTSGAGILPYSPWCAPIYSPRCKPSLPRPIPTTLPPII